MKKKQIDILSDRMVNAFLNDRIISPLPKKYSKKMNDAQKFRKLCESKIKKPIIGFKAAGTAFAVMKKLGEKEPFYATVYKKNLLKSGQKVKVNNYTLGIELEVCYLIKKEFFKFKNSINKNNIKKFITHMAPCIEIVGYRQRKKGISSFGDLCSDFGANIKFLIGKKKRFENVNIGNLKTNISNKKLQQSINGNTNTVYVNPINSLNFVLRKIKKDQITLDKDFYVFTGSTVGVVPVIGKGIYQGKIEKLGSVKTIIH